MAEHSSLLRPTPRRHFDFTPSSTEPPTPRTSSQESRTAPDPEAETNANALRISDRTRSILNLTSSTLFGIYAPSDSPKDGSSTPWGTGSETPGMRPSIDDNTPPVIGPYDRAQMHRRPSQPHVTIRNYYLPLTFRSILLFFFGVAYGSIVTHLHDNQQIAPVKVEGINRSTWHYLAFWGLAGVSLGKLLPLIDVFWEKTLGDGKHPVEASAASDTSDQQDEGDVEDERSNTRLESVLEMDWTPAVRSIGAFVGIAFAIVRPASARRLLRGPRTTLLMLFTAQTSLAIDAPSLSYSSHGQPRPLVPHRSLKTRLSPICPRRYRRHCRCPWSKSKYSSHTTSTIPESTCASSDEFLLRLFQP